MARTFLTLEIPAKGTTCFVHIWLPYYIHIIESTETLFFNR